MVNSIITYNNNNNKKSSHLVVDLVRCEFPDEQLLAAREKQIPIGEMRRTLYLMRGKHILVETKQNNRNRTKIKFA